MFMCFHDIEHKKRNENIWNEKNSIVFRLDLVGHQVPYTIGRVLEHKRDDVAIY